MESQTFFGDINAIVNQGAQTAANIATAYRQFRGEPNPLNQQGTIELQRAAQSRAQVQSLAILAIGGLALYLILRKSTAGRTR